MASPLTTEAVLAAVDAVMLRPFEWSVCDCCTAACDVFERLHGIDPMAHLREQYGSKRGAIALIRESGGLLSIAQSISAHLGAVEGHATGGIALSEDHRSLMVCIELGLWAAKSETGFVLLSRAAKGWHLA